MNAKKMIVFAFCGNKPERIDRSSFFGRVRLSGSNTKGIRCQKYEVQWLKLKPEHRNACGNRPTNPEIGRMAF